MQHVYHAEAETGFTGTITLRQPSFDEQCEFTEKSIIAEQEASDIPKAAFTMRFTRFLVSTTEGFCVAVALKHVASGDEITSFEAMKARRDCWPMLGTVARRLLMDGWDAKPEGAEGNSPTP